MRCNRKHRDAASVTVEQAVYKMKIARPTTASADREPSGQMGFRSCRESGTFFVPHVDPLDGSPRPKSISESVERVSDHTVDSFHTCDFQSFSQHICCSFVHRTFSISLALCIAAKKSLWLCWKELSWSA